MQDVVLRDSTEIKIQIFVCFFAGSELCMTFITLNIYAFSFGFSGRDSSTNDEAACRVIRLYFPLYDF